MNIEAGIKNVMAVDIEAGVYDNWVPVPKPPLGQIRILDRETLLDECAITKTLSIEEESLLIEEEFDYLDGMGGYRPIQCHYCNAELVASNNHMTRAMNNEPSPAFGFGWISVIVEPFNEVPCCDSCFENPNTKYLMA